MCVCVCVPIYACVVVFSIGRATGGKLVLLLWEGEQRLRQYFPSLFCDNRGYVWEPDRNNDDEGKEFITFIAQVEGLSAVPDGRIYMNAFIDTVEGKR